MELKEKIKLLKEGRIKFTDLSNDEVAEAFEKKMLRVRKLTPRECFRLMGVDEDVIDKIQSAKFDGKSVIPGTQGKGISRSQQYKMAGNSIVVDCLEGIFENLFYPPVELKQWLLF